MTDNEYYGDERGWRHTTPMLQPEQFRETLHNEGYKDLFYKSEGYFALYREKYQPSIVVFIEGDTYKIHFNDISELTQELGKMIDFYLGRGDWDVANEIRNVFENLVQSGFT